MAIITGLTAARMIEMENATIVDGNVVGDELILVTRDGTQINAGNVRGPQGLVGPTGPLDQITADNRYVNINGDTMTDLLTLNHTLVGAECIRMIHPTAPYLSFYNGGTRVAYIQGQPDEFRINSESGPITLRTNGIEQARLRTGTGDELFTLNGNPDCLIYMRASVPDGTVYNYVGKQAGWGLRASGITGDTLLQSANGDVRLQSKFSVDVYPGDSFSATFLPQGHVMFGKEEIDDDVVGFCWRQDRHSVRVIGNVANVPSVYLNRRSTAASAGASQDYMRFDANDVQVGGIQRTSGGVAYNTTSDYRSKTVVGPIEGALDRLGILKPIRAVYNRDVTGSEVDAFIAHEVSEAVPEAVTGEKDAVATDENTDILGTPVGEPILQQLDVSRLVPLLVAAVQELSAKVDELQARLDAA